MGSRPHRRMPPSFAARQQPGAERRQKPRRYHRGLPTPARADHAEQPGAGQARRELPNEPFPSEEGGGVLLPEGGQSLVGASPDFLVVASLLIVPVQPRQP